MPDDASPKSLHLSGRTALVTGSTRQGIGATTAMALAFRGAKVILNFGTGSRDAAARQRADALANKLDGLGGRVAVIEASIQSEAEIKELFLKATELFGGVDILVNNAGGTWLEQDFAGIETRHWEQAVRSEIDGIFYCIRAALPHM